MPASRQHYPAQATGTACFHEQFQKSRAARYFLGKVLAGENPDVTVARRGGAGAPSKGGGPGHEPARVRGCRADQEGAQPGTHFMM
jgi:hypothetical protein